MQVDNLIFLSFPRIRLLDLVKEQEERFTAAVPEKCFYQRYINFSLELLQKWMQTAKGMHRLAVSHKRIRTKKYFPDAFAVNYYHCYLLPDFCKKSTI